MKHELDSRPPEDVARQVRQSLPDLFEKKYKSVLYIGANHIRQHFLKNFVADYDKVIVLEIHPDNVRHVKEKYAEKNIQIIQGDVRHVDSLILEKFDVCFFWHGPEHLTKLETRGVLTKLESMTNHLIVLGMPYGRYEQGAEYGNVHETHLWDIYPENVKDLGYFTDVLGDADDTQANMMAWKRIASEKSAYAQPPPPIYA